MKNERRPDKENNPRTLLVLWKECEGTEWERLCVWLAAWLLHS